MDQEVPTEQEEGDKEPLVEGPMVSIYRKYVGEPDTRRDVHIGFGLFFGGIAIGVIALGLFLYSGTQPPRSNLFWQFREIALIFALLALPGIALSVAVLLPVGRHTMAASLLGTAVCVVAIGWFTLVYPFEWTAAGNDIVVISSYSVGLALLAASTGSALVAQYLERVGPAETGTVDDSSVDTEGETVSDEQVEADIEEALSDSTLTWGGLEHQPTTERLKLDMPETEIDRADIGPATETRSSGDDVDSAVVGLRQLQGNSRKTARAESPDEQVTALTEFRREREQEEQQLETGVEEELGFLARLRKLVLGR